MFPPNCSVCHQVQENCKCRQFQPAQGVGDAPPPQNVKCPFCGEKIEAPSRTIQLTPGSIAKWLYQGKKQCCKFGILNLEESAGIKTICIRQSSNQRLSLAKDIFCPQCEKNISGLNLNPGRLYFCTSGHIFSPDGEYSADINSRLASIELLDLRPSAAPTSSPRPMPPPLMLSGAPAPPFANRLPVSLAPGAAARAYPAIPSPYLVSAAHAMPPFATRPPVSLAPSAAAKALYPTIQYPSATSAASSRIVNKLPFLSEGKCGICSKVMLPGDLCKKVESSHAITLKGYYYICIECAKSCPVCLLPMPQNIQLRYIGLGFLAPSFYRVCPSCGQNYYKDRGQTQASWLLERTTYYRVGFDRSPLLKKKIVSSKPCEACAQEKQGLISIPPARHMCPERAWQEASKHHHQPPGSAQQPPSNTAGAASSGTGAFPSVPSPLQQQTTAESNSCLACAHEHLIPIPASSAKHTCPGRKGQPVSSAQHPRVSSQLAPSSPPGVSIMDASHVASRSSALVRAFHVQMAIWLADTVHLENRERDKCDVCKSPLSDHVCHIPLPQNLSDNPAYQSKHKIDTKFVLCEACDKSWVKCCSEASNNEAVDFSSGIFIWWLQAVKQQSNSKRARAGDSTHC